MVTVLEEYYRRTTFRCAFFFCGQKDSVQRISMKKYFLCTVGSVCNVKFNLRGKRFADDEEVETGAEVAETVIKRLLHCGFRRTGKAIGQLYQCWSRICREIKVPGSNITYFMFYIHL
jgi:hypothetical protein